MTIIHKSQQKSTRIITTFPYIAKCNDQLEDQQIISSGLLNFFEIYLLPNLDQNIVLANDKLYDIYGM